MKITLLQIDKTQEEFLNVGIEIYTKRLKNYTSFVNNTITIPKNSRLRTFNEQK